MGDPVVVATRNGISQTREAMQRSGCSPWGDLDAGVRYEHPIDQWSHGVVVAVTTECATGELLLIEADNQRVAILADAVYRAPPRCGRTAARLRDRVVQAWDACLAKLPRSAYRTGIAEVHARFDEAGSVTDVSWQGKTGWGPSLVTCMIDGVKHAGLDTRDCGGTTVRFTHSYLSR